QGPGGGINSNQCSAAHAERVDHERDGACELARYRQAVAKLDPPHIGEPQRVANRSHSALPSRWAPQPAPRPLMPTVRGPCAEPLPSPVPSPRAPATGPPAGPAPGRRWDWRGRVPPPLGAAAGSGDGNRQLVEATQDESVPADRLARSRDLR